MRLAWEVCVDGKAAITIPVGTRVTLRPPDRFERALLTHSAPTSGV